MKTKQNSMWKKSECVTKVKQEQAEHRVIVTAACNNGDSLVSLFDASGSAENNQAILFFHDI